MSSLGKEGSGKQTVMKAQVSERHQVSAGRFISAAKKLHTEVIKANEDS